MFSLDDLRDAAALIQPDVPPTPQYAWPLLKAAIGVDVRVKHENHTPIGAFKVRGGLVFMERLKRETPDCPGIVTATRGNHGQSLAFAGRKYGVPVTIVVPHGNSVEKNDAMRALGATLVEHGTDFDEARLHAESLAGARGLVMAPSFAVDLVKGVATYALEFLSAFPDLEAVYVPIGLGSGICGMITARDLLGHKAEIVGVVADGAPSYALSFERGGVVETNSARTFADGMACRIPNPDALAIIVKGAARIVTVSDDEIADAVRLIYRATHNIAEGAGAAGLAALCQERGKLAGRVAGAILSGQNIDTPWLIETLSGNKPSI
ncbi:MAG: threonine dehydratase [Rhodobiaceae bacterium]|nr:threonine dehydratase [Rhodobiaceae bacterium]